MDMGTEMDAKAEWMRWVGSAVCGLRSVVCEGREGL